MLIIEKQIKNDRESYVSNRGRRKTVLKTFRPAILPITGRTSGNFDVYVLASITRFIDRSLKNFSRDYTPPLERERERENSKGGKFQVCCRLIGVYHLFFFFYYYFSSAKDSLKTTTSCGGWERVCCTVVTGACAHR